MYPEGLTVHAYDLAGTVRLGVFAAEAAAGDTVVMRLSETSEPLPQETDPRAVDYSRFGHTASAVLGDVPHVSIFAINTPGVLSWQCLESDLTLVLSTGGRVPDEGLIAILSRGDRLLGRAQDLEVIEGMSDSVVLPPEWAEVISEVFSDSKTIALEIPADTYIMVPSFLALA